MSPTKAFEVGMDLLDPLVPEQQPVASGQPLPELVRVLHLETMEEL